MAALGYPAASVSFFFCLSRKRHVKFMFHWRLIRARVDTRPHQNTKVLLYPTFLLLNFLLSNSHPYLGRNSMDLAVSLFSKLRRKPASLYLSLICQRCGQSSKLYIKGSLLVESSSSRDQFQIQFTEGVI